MMSAAVRTAPVTENTFTSATLPTAAPDTPLKDRIILDTNSEELAVYTGPGLEPIQITILARLEPGIGDKVYAAGLRTIQAHPKYLFEEGEHSALIFRTSMRDESALYSLAVGEEALTWHRHPTCAHRIITITTGSGGAVARFSLATDEEIAHDPAALIKKMIVVELPADSQVSLRFNGLTYHQFGPRHPNHPAFVGQSVHKNEREELAEVHAEEWCGTADRTAEEDGSIPLLTRCIPTETLTMLAAPGALDGVTTVRL
ncbi:MAG: hypothetical protein RL417_653 [Pseudomonadota bacterium]|jgi:hypothetical protein